jgi:hypothetical protein
MVSPMPTPKCGDDRRRAPPVSSYRLARYDRRHAALPETVPQRQRLLHQILTIDQTTPTSTRRLFDILQDCNEVPLTLQIGAYDYEREASQHEDINESPDLA